MATWANITGRTIRSVQAATEAPPLLASEGFDLNGVEGFTLKVACDAGKVINSAAGQFDLWHLDPVAGLPWSKLIDREQQIPASAVGLASFSWLFDVVNARGRVAFLANGLDLTGGGVTITFMPTIKYVAGSIV
jgi:hypothetical protein